jgi:cell division protein ZapA (FtsZ GTPase activity inhibitor)
MASQKIVVEIFGQSLNLKSAADPKYAFELAQFVDEQIHKVSSQSNDPLKVVLLASMNIANELFQERKSRKESLDAVSERADSMLEMMERSL